MQNVGSFSRGVVREDFRFQEHVQGAHFVAGTPGFALHLTTSGISFFSQVCWSPMLEEYVSEQCC